MLWGSSRFDEEPFNLKISSLWIQRILEIEPAEDHNGPGSIQRFRSVPGNLLS